MRLEWVPRGMLILAFDTTSERGGVAIHRDFECLASAGTSGTRYSITLFETVERLLAEAGATLGDIDLFAVATGPGSFTGIRVGVAAAQGWAQVLGRPVVGVSVLEAMVEEAWLRADWALPVLDARRGEFFLGVYRRTSAGDAGPARPCGSGPWGDLRVQSPGESEHWMAPTGQPGEEPGMLLRAELVGPFLERFAGRQVAGETVTCLAREHDSPAQALRQDAPDGVGWQIVERPLMSAIARLALFASRDGRVQPPDKLDAYYLRRSDAEMHWRES